MFNFIQTNLSLSGQPHRSHKIGYYKTLPKSLKTDTQFQFRLYTINTLPSKYNIIITEWTVFYSEMHALCCMRLQMTEFSPFASVMWYAMLKFLHNWDVILRQHSPHIHFSQQWVCRLAHALSHLIHTYSRNLSYVSHFFFCFVFFLYFLNFTNPFRGLSCLGIYSTRQTF